MWCSYPVCPLADLHSGWQTYRLFSPDPLGDAIVSTKHLPTSPGLLEVATLGPAILGGRCSLFADPSGWHSVLSTHSS